MCICCSRATGLGRVSLCRLQTCGLEGNSHRGPMGLALSAGRASVCPSVKPQRLYAELCPSSEHDWVVAIPFFKSPVPWAAPPSWVTPSNLVAQVTPEAPSCHHQNMRCTHTAQSFPSSMLPTVCVRGLVSERHEEGYDL